MNAIGLGFIEKGKGLVNILIKNVMLLFGAVEMESSNFSFLYIEFHTIIQIYNNVPRD